MGSNAFLIDVEELRNMEEVPCAENSGALTMSLSGLMVELERQLLESLKS